ncbi:MAG TPA: glycosyltransferase family 2 protein [Pyrinomonadaceae bacterium]|nr:glycosyltransferase family 2 protein [Pyrinomonadaceae bacterium]
MPFCENYRVKISAKIITWNEEQNIAELCEGLGWADEIVVVDSFSTDKTVEIARRYTEKVIQNEFKSHGDQHTFADAQTTGDWIFWIDGDERVTQELVESIQQLRDVPDSELANGYWFARKTHHLGEWIRFCGWYPDRQMRLYRKAVSHWDGTPPHETARVSGRTETLAGHILHYPKRDLSTHHMMIDKYATLAAAHHLKKGADPGYLTLLTKPVASFIRAFVVKQGFRDGVRGLIISTSTAYGVFLKYAKMWEARHVKN